MRDRGEGSSDSRLERNSGTENPGHNPDAGISCQQLVERPALLTDENISDDSCISQGPAAHVDLLACGVALA